MTTLTPPLESLGAADEARAFLPPHDPAPVAPLVLIVDDNPVDRRLAGGLVEKRLGWRVAYAGTGAEAVALLGHGEPAVVLTDMLMPEMDGLELVEATRRTYPLIPVVLMTAYGSEDVAIRALQQGAASYVPKKALPGELAPTLEQVVAAGKANRQQQQMLECLTGADLHFVLGNDPALVPPLVTYLQEHLTRLGLCDETARIRVGIALEEALLNGIYHGNLEVGSAPRPDGGEPYRLVAESRRHAPPYAGRRLYVDARLGRDEAAYVIRDEGPGFDPTRLPDPTDPATLGRVGGRGLVLIRTFMDEVRFNARGNELTMVKRRDPRHGRAA